MRVEETGSTNDDAFRVLQAEDLCLVWTLNQTAGRGSRGRRWLAPKDSCLALSIGFRLESRPHPRDFCYPLFAGLLLLKGLASLTRPDGFCLKWPNDLLLRGRKLAGILCESRWRQQRGCLVIGVGVNLIPDTALDALPKGFASLAELDQPPEPRALVETLARSFLPSLMAAEKDPDLHEKWLTRSCHPLGSRLRVRAEGREIEGVVAGLDNQGALLIRCLDGALVAIRQTCEDFRVLEGGPRLP